MQERHEYNNNLRPNDEEQNQVKVAIFGASGFSRECADILLSLGIKKIVFIGTDSSDETYFGFTLISEKDVPLLYKEGFKFVIGIGDNKIRKKIFEKYHYLSFPNIIHQTASMGSKQYLEVANRKGNIITAGVRLTNNIKMGNFGIFNLNATVGHDCIVEDFVNIAPGTNISGNVEIREGAFIGTNASILQGSSIRDKVIIGKYSIVGAGSVVTGNILDQTTVLGIPARPI